MAQTQLSDVIIPDEFTAYQVENSLVSTALSQSGVPLNPLTGNNASVVNPLDWTDYDTARDAATRNAGTGIGVVLTPHDGLVCLTLTRIKQRTQTMLLSMKKAKANSATRTVNAHQTAVRTFGERADLPVR